LDFPDGDYGKSSTFSLLNPPYWFTACGCVKLLRCYLHNPQIAFLILKRLFWVNLWCIYGGKCDILQKMNSASYICATCCQYFGVLKGTSFCFCGPLGSSIFPWFIALYLWWKCNILKKNSVRHSCNYLPFDSVNIQLLFDFWCSICDGKCDLWKEFTATVQL